MKTRITVTVLIAAAVCFAANLSAGAGGKKDVDPKTQKAIEEMMKLGTPGEPHKLLAAMAGTWDAAVKMYMDPAASPTESKGTMVRKMILDGRFLEEKFVGDFGGMKFQGIGIAGYDNQKKKYIGSWIDSMSTNMMVMEGTYDAGKKTLTTAGTCYCPFEGGTVTMRGVLRIDGPDSQVQEMYKSAAGGKEHKVMEITYKRKGK